MIIKSLGKDFDLKKLARSGQVFRFNELKKDQYLLLSKDRALKIQSLEGGRTCFYCSEEEFRKFWSPYFDLDTPYEAIFQGILEKSDPYLAKAMKELRGIRILRQDPWETLISFIISQRKNIPAIKRAVEALAKAGGKKIPRPKEWEEDETFCIRELYAFPGPKDLLEFTDEDWASLRLGYREKYVRQAAIDTARGKIDLKKWAKLPDKELKDKLLGIYGVGEKVGSCVMLYGFHRLNSFPRDVWVNRVLEKEYGGEPDLKKYAPYSGLVQQYLFEYARIEMEKG